MYYSCGQQTAGEVMDDEEQVNQKTGHCVTCTTSNSVVEMQGNVEVHIYE